MLNNILNNNTTFIKLGKSIGFNLKYKRLYYIGHVLNLINKAYLYRQDASNFEKQFKEQELSSY